MFVFPAFPEIYKSRNYLTVFITCYLNYFFLNLSCIWYKHVDRIDAYFNELMNNQKYISLPNKQDTIIRDITM